MRKPEKVSMFVLVLFAELLVLAPIVYADIPAIQTTSKVPYFILGGLSVGVIALIAWLGLRRIRKNRTKNDDSQ